MIWIARPGHPSSMIANEEAVALKSSVIQDNMDAAEKYTSQPNAKEIRSDLSGPIPSETYIMLMNETMAIIWQIFTGSEKKKDG